MKKLKIAVAQFQPKDGDKEYNLSVIEKLTAIIDPNGDVLTEIKSFDDEIATAIITEDKLKLSGGYRYKNTRMPELYKDIIVEAHESKTKPVLMEKD